MQGVGFRWFVAKRAHPLALRGWVANLPDGTVEVVAEGPAADLGALEQALGTGPKSAHVERVDKSQLLGDVLLPNTFEIR